ncbi:MAG: histidine phosphatase family protein [Sandaracinus sp.]
MTEIVLLRHAETEWNAEGRWQGQSDVALSAKGRAEVRAVAERLAGERFDRIVSSDLSRAADTARGVAAGRPIELDPGLREMHLGSWCGLLHRDVALRYPDQLRALQNAEDVRIGGDGETVFELAARVTGVVGRLARETPDGRVLVVTHGGVVRALLLDLLALSGRTRPLFGARNTALTRIDVDANGAGQLVFYNDATHVTHDPLDGEELVRGTAGHAYVASLLALEAPQKLAPLGDHHETRTVPGKKQLVSYGVARARAAKT